MGIETRINTIKKTDTDITTKVISVSVFYYFIPVGVLLYRAQHALYAGFTGNNIRFQITENGI